MIREKPPRTVNGERRTVNALLVIDNEPIRRKLERELQSVREAIEQCEQEISRHERLDLPAFRQWLAVQCSDLLTERRLVEEKIWRLRSLLSAIQGLTRHGIRNIAAAFFWFHEIEQDRGTIPPYVRRAWEEVTVGPAERRREPGVESGRFTPHCEDDDTFSNPGDEQYDAGNEGSQDHGNPSDRGGRARHKSLFRKIALLLHPDMAGALTKQELELWYQAQRAYQEKDLVTLETILARCTRVGTKTLILSELREVVSEADGRLATLGKTVASLAELPSWRFLLLSECELKARLQVVRHELEGVIGGLRREAKMLENELERIEAQTARWLMRKRKEAEPQLALGV